MVIALCVLGFVSAGLIVGVLYLSMMVKELRSNLRKQNEEISALQKGKATKKELEEGLEAGLTSISESIPRLVEEATAARYTELEGKATQALFSRCRAVESRLLGLLGSAQKLSPAELEHDLGTARKKRDGFQPGSKDFEMYDYTVQRLKLDIALAHSRGAVTKGVLEAEIHLTRWEREHSQKGSPQWLSHNTRLTDLRARLAGATATNGNGNH